METCFDLGSIWNGGEVALFLTLAGVIDTAPPDCPDPFTMLTDGRWEDAYKWWHQRGFDYEACLALSLGDDEARLEAVRGFDRLGARPLANRLRRELTEAGVRSVPRQPSQRTGENSLGLTARQAEVLNLLGEGLTNAAIADRLFISTRTVDHHVSAILSRLSVATREEAAKYAAAPA